MAFDAIGHEDLNDVGYLMAVVVVAVTYGHSF